MDEESKKPITCMDVMRKYVKLPTLKLPTRKLFNQYVHLKDTHSGPTSSCTPLDKILRTPEPVSPSSEGSYSDDYLLESSDDCTLEPEQMLAILEQVEILVHKRWYHGIIPRAVAEELVVKDGDFLVRQSTTCGGQIILTIRMHGTVRHLQLVSASGVVRSKTRIYSSIPHLIKHHWLHEIPIRMPESLCLPALLLVTPVPRI